MIQTFTFYQIIKNNITMKIRNILLCVLLMSSSYLVGQSEDITARASVNRDSILLGNTLALTVTVEGAEIQDLDIDLPDNLQLISGPYQSSNMMMMNGVVSTTSSLTYTLEPSEVGTDFIPPILVTTSELTITTEPIEINTYPNPTNLTQEESFESPLSNQLQFNFDGFFGEDFQSLFNNDDFQSLFDQLDLQSLDKLPRQELEKENPTKEDTLKRKLKRI